MRLITHSSDSPLTGDGRTTSDNRREAFYPMKKMYHQIRKSLTPESFGNYFVIVGTLSPQLKSYSMAKNIMNLKELGYGG